MKIEFWPFWAALTLLGAILGAALIAFTDDLSPMIGASLCGIGFLMALHEVLSRRWPKARP